MTILSSISIELGKGVIAHNNRKFIAENVDKERTKNNIEYENIPLENAFHTLFDEALQRYNDRQKRADRQIENYLEHIRKSKQEKPFYEIIVQVGNREDMGINTVNEGLAKTILDEYMRGFQKRNPQLYVFNAHLHMDEATPHLHIDFIPFTAGSKRGLDTRVSMKKALESQGFYGSGRSDTETMAWLQSEKEALSLVMERHDVEWENQGNNREHLSVLEFKKEQRTKEVRALEQRVEELETRAVALTDSLDTVEQLNSIDEFEEEYQLPTPQRMESAKNYMKRVEEKFNKLKSTLKYALVKVFELKNENQNLKRSFRNLILENDELKDRLKHYQRENHKLHKQLKEYRLIKSVLGSDAVKRLLESAKNKTQLQRRDHNEKGIHR